MSVETPGHVDGPAPFATAIPAKPVAAFIPLKNRIMLAIGFPLVSVMAMMAFGFVGHAAGLSVNTGEIVNPLTSPVSTWAPFDPLTMGVAAICTGVGLTVLHPKAQKDALPLVSSLIKVFAALGALVNFAVAYDNVHEPHVAQQTADVRFDQKSLCEGAIAPNGQPAAYIVINDGHRIACPRP